MYAAWLSFKRPLQELHSENHAGEALLSTPQSSPATIKTRSRFHDLVDIDTVNLYTDEHEETDDDDEVVVRELAQRLHGKKRWLWSLYYFFI